MEVYFLSEAEKISIARREEEMESWIEKEIEDSTFSDARLKNRFRSLLEQLSNAIGKPIPFACQDWADTKTAYRFFSNERVSE